MGLRLAAAHRRVRRRPGRHPLLLGRRHQPLGRRLPDEHRLDPRRPAVARVAGSPTASAPRTRTCRRSSSCRTTTSQVVNGPRNWGAGFMPAVYQGTRLQGGAEPIPNLNTPEGVTTPEQQRPSSTSSTQLNRDYAAQRPRPDRARRPHHQLRAGLPHAGRGPRGGGPRQGDRGDQGALRHGPQGDGRRSAGSACSPAGWSSAACASSSSTTGPAASGTRTRSIEKNHAGAVPVDGPARRRAAHRT